MKIRFPLYDDEELINSSKYEITVIERVEEFQYTLIECNVKNITDIVIKNKYGYSYIDKYITKDNVLYATSFVVHKLQIV